MARVGAQAQTPTQVGLVDNASVAVEPPVGMAPPPFPHAARTSDTPTVPAVLSTYVSLWLADLAALAKQAGLSLTPQSALARLAHLS